MAELNLRPCQKCKGKAKIKEGAIKGYYAECVNGCCYTPIVINRVMAATRWNSMRVTVREGRDHVNDT